MKMRRFLKRLRAVFGVRFVNLSVYCVRDIYWIWRSASDRLGFVQLFIFSVLLTDFLLFLAISRFLSVFTLAAPPSRL